MDITTAQQPAVPRPTGHTYLQLRRLYAEISEHGVLCPLTVAVASARRGAVALRHDVDLSLDLACELAEREYAWGVRATYFVRADDRAYSLESPASLAAIHRIAEWHEIGLHAVVADPGQTPDAEPVIGTLLAQRDHLAERTRLPITAFSYHKPPPGLLWGDPLVAGLHNAYAEAFKGRYVSDSGGAFSDQAARRVIGMARDGGGQLLVHPVWWGPAAASPAGRLEALLRGTDERQRGPLAAEIARTVSWWRAEAW